MLSTLLAAVLLASPVPECVIVTSDSPADSLPARPASRNVDIIVNFRGKPLPAAVLNLSTGKGEFLYRVPLDAEGAGHLRGLKPGTYIAAVFHHGYDHQLRLDVPPGAKGFVTSVSLELFERSAADFAWMNEVPVTEHFRRFAGTVSDLTGAAAPGAGIEIYPDGALEISRVVTATADASGKFSVELPNGVYRAMVREQGFQIYRIGFRIEDSAAPKDVSVVLQIGGGC